MGRGGESKRLIGGNKMMRLNKPNSQPTLLMLSDSFPDPDGGERAARAWWLLCSASTTHRVYLAAIASRAVNLACWRLVSDLTQRVHIESKRSRLNMQTPINGEARIWTQQRRFDMLLSTTPTIWPSSDLVQADQRVCDLGTGLDTAGGHRADPLRLLGRLMRSRGRRGAGGTRPTRSLEACDALLIDSHTMPPLMNAGTAPMTVVANHTHLNDWAGFVQSLNPRISNAPSVTVIPVQPLPVRKAA